MDGCAADASERAAALACRYGQLSGEALLRPMIETEFHGRIALVSSFGAEAAVLLHVIAAIDPARPVLFLETGKHFAATLRYRDALVARLGLTDIRNLRPAAVALEAADPMGALWRTDPAHCCFLRKAAPLVEGLAPFAARITGRKRYHGGERGSLPVIEAADGRIKINPLAPLGAAATARNSPPATCRLIRWRRTDFSRSAACLAPLAPRRRTIRARDDGPASTAPSAVSIAASGRHRAIPDMTATDPPDAVPRPLSAATPFAVAVRLLI